MTDVTGRLFRRLAGLVPSVLTIATVLALVAAPLAAPLRAQQAPTAPPSAPPVTPREGVNNGFVHDQTWLGALVYAPSFATTITSDGLGWTAGYLVVAGGSFFAAAELSRDLNITEPMRRLANGAALHGAAAALLVSGIADASAKTAAGAVFIGSVGGTALALSAGKGVTDDEVAGALFGADAGALVGFGTSRSMRSATSSGDDRASAIAALTGMLVGAPLGGAYVASVPYRVTAGDVETLWPSAAIGATAAYAAVANSQPSNAAQAGALLTGGALGLLAGDRWLVRRYDHTRNDAQMLALGTVAGGLMGAGVSQLTGASRDRFSHGGAHRGWCARWTRDGRTVRDARGGCRAEARAAAGAPGCRAGGGDADAGRPYASAVDLLDSTYREYH
jgi:hypothetical protein